MDGMIMQAASQVPTDWPVVMDKVWNVHRVEEANKLSDQIWLIPISKLSDQISLTPISKLSDHIWLIPIPKLSDHIWLIPIPKLSDYIWLIPIPKLSDHIWLIPICFQVRRANNTRTTAAAACPKFSICL